MEIENSTNLKDGEKENETNLVHRSTGTIEHFPSVSTSTNYVKDCAQVMQHFSKNVSNQFLEKSGSTREQGEGLTKILTDTPKEILIVGMLLATFLIGIMSFTSSFPLIIVTIGGIAFLAVGLYTFVAKVEINSQSEKERMKQNMALDLQTFSANKVIDVQRKTQELHGLANDTFSDSINLLASSKLEQIKEMDKIHEKEMIKNINVANILQTGANLRNQKKCQAKIESTETLVKSKEDVAEIKSSIKIHGAKTQRETAAQQIENDLLLSKTSSSSTIQIKNLQTEYSAEMMRRSVESETGHILADRDRKIAEERKRTEECRRKNQF